MLAAVAEEVELEELGGDDVKSELVVVADDDAAGVAGDGAELEIAHEVGWCGNGEWEEKGHERAVW